MTDREFLVELKSMVDAQLGTVVIPVPPPTPPDPTPPMPPDTPPSTDVDGAFTWENVGEVKHVLFDAGHTYCFSNVVPAGFHDLQGEIIPVTSPERSPDYVHRLQIWQSLTPRGEVFQSSTYDGPWNTAGLMSTPVAMIPAGPVYFNVVVSETGYYGVKQIHS